VKDRRYRQLFLKSHLHNEKLNLNNNKGAIAATCCLIDSGTSDSYQ
jgi:hypothetical protein